MGVRPEWVAGFRVEFVAAARGVLEAVRRESRAAVERRLVARAEREIARAFVAQGAALVARLPRVAGRWPLPLAEGARFGLGVRGLREAFGDEDWGPLWDEVTGAEDEALLEAIQAAARAALRAGAAAGQGLADAAVIARYGLSWTLENARAAAYLVEHGAALVTRIDEATRKDLRSLVEAAMREGRSYDQLAEDIMTQFRHYGEPGSYWRFDAPRPQGHIDSRAHLIAVTEIGHAYEDGEWQAMQEMQAAGLTVTKWWSTMGDDRVSAGCLANEADGVLGLDEPHSSGDMHPLRFPGCRCTENYEVE